LRWSHQDDRLTLPVLLDGLTKKMRRAFAVDAIFPPERRVDVIYFAPIDVQDIKTFGPRIRARIKVEMELGV